jgi:pimeloyl-ACP methyl ester carboxylesterase
LRRSTIRAERRRRRGHGAVELPTATASGTSGCGPPRPRCRGSRGTGRLRPRGPGVADTRGDAEAFSRLLSDGHDLIVYDRVVTGHSERLDDPRDYTLERDVDDLEALIAELDLDWPILIGHS